MLLRRAWMPVSLAMITGLALGWMLNNRQPVFAGGSTDRHEDFIMATGPINQTLTINSNQSQNVELDGVWILDYKSGKLLATTMNRQTGKMIAFGEVDLVKEFEIAPRANVHFVMTTGLVIRGQSVLYLMETTTGKVAVYSMFTDEFSQGNRSERILIRRHDMASIRTGTVPPPADVQNLGQSPLPRTQTNMMPNQYSYPPAMQQQMPNPVQPPAPVNPLQQTGFVNPNK